MFTMMHKVNNEKSNRTCSASVADYVFNNFKTNILYFSMLMNFDFFSKFYRLIRDIYKCVHFLNYEMSDEV